MLPRIVGPSAEHPADEPRQHSPARVELQRDLAGTDAEQLGDARLEDLLDPLQLDEVVARPNGAEAQASKLDDQGRQLPAERVAASVRVEIHTAALFDPSQLGGVQLETICRERRPFDAGADHLSSGQPRRRSALRRHRLTYAFVECRDRALRGPLDVQ